jgi:hypothetical protein
MFNPQRKCLDRGGFGLLCVFVCWEEINAIEVRSAVSPWKASGHAAQEIPVSMAMAGAAPTTAWNAAFPGVVYRFEGVECLLPPLMMVT